jgi:hypothetical protein
MKDVQHMIIEVLKAEKVERMARRAKAVITQGFDISIYAMVTCTLPKDDADIPSSEIPTMTPTEEPPLSVPVSGADRGISHMDVMSQSTHLSNPILEAAAEGCGRTDGVRHVSYYGEKPYVYIGWNYVASSVLVECAQPIVLREDGQPPLAQPTVHKVTTNSSHTLSMHEEGAGDDPNLTCPTPILEAAAEGKGQPSMSGGISHTPSTPGEGAYCASHTPLMHGEGAGASNITIKLSDPSGGIHKYSGQQRLYQCLHDFLKLSTWKMVSNNST